MRHPKIQHTQLDASAARRQRQTQDIHFFALNNSLKTDFKMVAGTKRPTAGGGGLKGAGATKRGKVTRKFIINATQPTNDRIFDPSAFTTFLQQRIKVDGRTGNLGDTVAVSNLGDGRIEVVAHQEFSGRYLKYLTKKFLKKQQLRDWLRVVSTSKGEYSLKFFNVVGEEGDDDDE